MSPTAWILSDKLGRYLRSIQTQKFVHKNYIQSMYVEHMIVFKSTLETITS